jgi:hypothetical protein
MKWWIFLAWIAVAGSSHISCSTTTVCVLERVQLQYTVTAADLAAAHTSYTHAPLVWAGIYESSSGNSSTLRARIDLYQQQLVSTHLQQVHSVIHSADNPGEAPAVLTAEWSISSDAFRRLILRFNGPTNAPALTDPVSINNAVSLQHGTVIVSAAEAEWLDSATLALSALDDLAWQAVMSAIEAQTLHVAARTKLLPGHFLNASADSNSSSSAAVSGSAALRLGTRGLYQLRLYIDDTQIAVAAQVLTVQACDEESVLLLSQTSTTSSSSSGTLTAAAVQPFWSMPGVLALSGYNWLELPDKLISDNISSSSSSSSSAVSADWSISFCLYVQEDASASLPLALFSKGDG